MPLVRFPPNEERKASSGSDAKYGRCGFELDGLETRLRCPLLFLSRSQKVLDWSQGNFPCFRTFWPFKKPLLTMEPLESEVEGVEEHAEDTGTDVA